jgi:hypothetical protein
MRIHDILVRIRGSMPLTNGSGSDPATFVIDLQDANKTLICKKIFSAYYFLKVHLHHFSKIRRQKRSNKTVGIKVFLTIFGFLLDSLCRVILCSIIADPDLG